MIARSNNLHGAGYVRLVRAIPITAHRRPNTGTAAIMIGAGTGVVVT